MTEDHTPPMSRPRVAAGALFFDDEGRVLLVKPSYKDGWDIPGGYVEPGETPAEACEREIKEELGVERKVRRLLVVDWAPSQQEGDKVLFVFDGGSIPDPRSITLATVELDDWGIFAQDRFHDLFPARLARRVRLALDARSIGRTRYAEHGTAIDS